MKQLFFAIIAVLCFSGCGKHMYSTMSSGKDNQSFIIVLRQDQAFQGSRLLLMIKIILQWIRCSK